MHVIVVVSILILSVPIIIHEVLDNSFWGPIFFTCQMIQTIFATMSGILILRIFIQIAN